MQKALCFVAALLLMACSSEENVMDEAHKVDVGKGITFQFNEEAFVPGTINKKGTRAAQTPEVIDLGNGLTAEVALEPDTLGLTQTRAANPIPDGHYKIYAIDASNVRHDGIDGNVSGGVFTANPPGRWELNSGETYTFVCINDAMVDNGTSLSYTYSHDQTALQPLIGVTQHQVSNMGDDVVSFVMRHQNARVRFQITSYTAPCMNLKMSFFTDPTIAPCGVTNYNLKGTITGYLNSVAAQTLSPISLTADKPYTTSSVTETYKTSTNYLYYPGHFQMWMAHYVSWQGTVYGKHDIFNDNNITHIPFSNQATDFLERNHSYVYNIKIRPSVLYLFSDGTVGTLGDKGSRTPIGIVVKEKTSESDKGTACALDILATSPWKNVGDHIEENVHPSPTNMAEAAADMNGENWTYNANLQGIVRSNQATTYPAFYQAAHYTPGVATASSIGRWYLPSYGELIKFVQVFQKGFTPTATEPVSPHYDQMSTGFETKVRNAFTQVSKPDIHGQFIISSTQIYGGTPSMGFRPTYINIWGGDQLYTGFCWNTMSNSATLPFVHF